MRHDKISPDLTSLYAVSRENPKKTAEFLIRIISGKSNVSCISLLSTRTSLKAASMRVMETKTAKTVAFFVIETKNSPA
ncbi:hypothetical protein HK25_13070 [Acetobacter sp. DsW_059]|nr:hypothetical protein HK25_13070 [Acetobacter sp. DsW_059]